MKKLLVFQTWGIGDMIMTTPMLAALRQALPASRITVVAGSEESAQVISGSSLCDEVRVISPKMRWADLARAFFALRRERFDAAIVCTNISLRAAQVLRAICGIKIVAGNSPGRHWGYTHWQPIEPNLHRVILNLKILRTILPGAPQCSTTYFHVDEQSRANASRRWAEWGLDGRNVLAIHPGSGSAGTGKQKRIPPDKCTALISLFLKRFPETRVLTLIGPEDGDVVQHFCGLDQRVRLVERLPLREVAAILSRTRALVSGNTGMAHLGAAMGVPVMTLTGPTPVPSTEPWGAGHTVVRTEERLDCMPCWGTPYYDNCPYAAHCMAGIREEQVLELLTPIFQSKARP